MKKIFTFFAAALTALSMSAASYGILVNGKTYFAGTQVDEYEGFQQYLAHVPVKAGDFCQLCDAENKSVWAVDLNTQVTEKARKVFIDGQLRIIRGDKMFDATGRQL